MSLFERHKVLHALPKDGQKVTYKEPATHHWFRNVIEDQKLLEIGKEYTVRKTQLNSSSTYVWFEELEVYDVGRDLPFFSLSRAFFEWDIPYLDPNDLIGLDARSCLTLQHFYKDVGIELDGSVHKEGNPMLVMEYDKTNHDIVTNAYYKQ